MKVTIIGKGRGWEDAPLEGRTWGITQLILQRPVCLVIDMNNYSDGRWGEKEAVEALVARGICKRRGIPYICLENYPLKVIKEFFETDYFSNTIDYAIALAIYQKFSEIALYGVNMEVDTEYSYQKPGVDFWCGVAKGRGIQVKVFGQHSTIMKTKDGLLYGYDYPQGGIYGRHEESKDRDLLSCL